MYRLLKLWIYNNSCWERHVWRDVTLCIMPYIGYWINTVKIQYIAVRIFQTPITAVNSDCTDRHLHTHLAINWAWWFIKNQNLSIYLKRNNHNHMLFALTIRPLKYVLQTDSLFTTIINLDHPLVSQIVFPCPKRRHSFNYKAKQDEIIRRH